MIDVKRPVETNFPGYFRAPTDEFLDMAKSGVTAIYLYSANVLKNSEIHPFCATDKSVRTMVKFGTTYVPVSLFLRFLGSTADISCECVTLTFGEKRVSKSTVDEKPLIYVGETALVPLYEVADALELSYGVFHKDRLTVFAAKDVLEALSADPMLVRGACYAVFGKYSTDHLTHEDFVFAKDKWRRVLVGSPEINDPADPDMNKKLEEISERCKSAWEKMNLDRDAVILWGDTPPKESSDLRVQYLNILTLALGYATPGTACYKNENLKRDILFAFEWMYENMYGESVIEGRGWRDPHLFNWWEWMTGAVDPMTDALMVMEDCFDMETLKKYFRCYDYVCTFHRTGYREDHASTRLKVGTKVALLLEDKERLFYRFLDYDLQYEPLGPQKGKYTDFVCWTHGFPYNMMYGLIYLNRTLFVASNLFGTAMEFTSPDFYDMFSVAKYMYDAAMYRGRGFAVFRGRGFGAEKDSGSNALNGILPMIGAFGEEEDNYLKKMVKLGCSDPEVKRMLISRASVHDLALIKSILADERISYENDKELAYSWFTADRFAQHRRDYAFMLAMPSSRHMSYESINSAHKMGWYTGDGALYLYTNADSTSFDFAAFQSNPNICYRMPGVTADSRERTVWSYRHGWRGTKDFSGSMDFLGKYGVAAFDYEPYHYEGREAEGTTDDGYGGGFTYYENDLTAKKSYHFFDEECVCLGAGITSTMDSPVRTTVEHRRLVSNAKSVSVNGEIMPDLDFERKLSGSAFATVEGVGGYVFTDGSTVSVRRYTYDSSDGVQTDGYTESTKLSRQSFIDIGVEHGTNPKGATYAYVILPLSDENSTRVYTSNPKIEILSNTEKLQAVRKPSLGITSAAIFEPCTVGLVTANVPCLVMYKEADDGLTLSVCDPTQKLECGEITVSGSFECVCASAELSVLCEAQRVSIGVDFKNLAGKNLEIVLKNK